MDSNAADTSMSYAHAITGLSADAYGAGSAIWAPNLNSVACEVFMPGTHVPNRPTDLRLLSTADNTIFWAPPQVGYQHVFDDMMAELLEEDPDSS